MLGPPAGRVSGISTPPIGLDRRPFAAARALHADRDPRRVRHRGRREATRVARGRSLGPSIADRHVRVHARQERRQLLADDALPRLRDQPDLIHWESQSTTSTPSPVGQRYINHVERGTNVVLFSRFGHDRAFWCLGPARTCDMRATGRSRSSGSSGIDFRSLHDPWLQQLHRHGVTAAEHPCADDEATSRR